MDDAGRSADQLVSSQCAVTNAGADGRAHHAHRLRPDRGSHDRSATGAYAQLSQVALAVLVGGNVAFSLGLVSEPWYR
jgi:hypothetical protein